MYYTNVLFYSQKKRYTILKSIRRKKKKNPKIKREKYMSQNRFTHRRSEDLGHPTA